MTNQTFDLIIRGGTVYDGSGNEPFVSDVATGASASANHPFPFSLRPRTLT